MNTLVQSEPEKLTAMTPSDDSGISQLMTLFDLVHRQLVCVIDWAKLIQGILKKLYFNFIKIIRKIYFVSSIKEFPLLINKTSFKILFETDDFTYTRNN